MNKISKEVLSDALLHFNRDSLRQIMRHSQTSMSLARKFADDENAIRQEPLYVELERLNTACQNLLARAAARSL
jgi:hypothetical protein